ncbi:MAG: 16S rRNA methyltransferase [Candidatus Hodarchaeota archaeon]
MLHVILLDCAVELVPSELSALKQIQKHAGKRGKKPTQILLDQTHHGQVMTKLEDGTRRGRPDIVFISLLSLLETPLCKERLLTVHLHLQDGRIIEVNPEVRLPRNYDRFVGLIEQLLLTGKVPPKGDALLRVTRESIQDLVKRFYDQDERAISVLCVEKGPQTSVAALGEMMPQDISIPFILGVGAFPHGDLPSEVVDIFEKQVELDKEMMMTWHICAEALWLYSMKVGVVRKRYSE